MASNPRTNLDPDNAPRSRPGLRDGVARPSYALGAPISLADLLALPPDGCRYGRDEKGRLILTPPDHAAFHRQPISAAIERLVRALQPRAFAVVPEASIAFDPIYALSGAVLPASHHGPKALLPDITVFRRPVRWTGGPSGNTWYAPEGIELVVEFISPSSWRNDLGDGTSAEEVDRWRTYLECGVAEYWVLNAAFDGCGLPPRSALALSLDRERATWSELPVEAAAFAPSDFRGRRPLTAGRIRSLALDGVALDLEELWRDCGLAPAS